MIYLFIHQNFPGQYRLIVRELADESSNSVYFITQPNRNEMVGVHKISYAADPRSQLNCHPFAVDIDRAIHAGARVADVCRTLRDERGVRPDLIVGHSGWGETLFVKDVFPDVPLLANFEFYYHSRGVDVGFDPEFGNIFNNPSQLRVRNATNLLAFQASDWGHTATQWQQSLYPPEMRRRISIIHEGVDTDIVRPNAAAAFRIPGSGQVLTPRDEIVTYVARNLEPYRGFHVFMRALPTLLRRRKRLRVLIVGGDEVSYGAPPQPGSTFRELLLRELGKTLDRTRVHFLGHLDYDAYLNVLQVSSVHVYLTYPFVLSWSFIEALASGCLVVGSATAPVLEVLRDGENGLTTDFFSSPALANRIESALEDRKQLQPLRTCARETAVQGFDLRRRQLPRWKKLFGDLANGHRPAPGKRAK